MLRWCGGDATQRRLSSGNWGSVSAGLLFLMPDSVAVMISAMGICSGAKQNSVLWQGHPSPVG